MKCDVSRIKWSVGEASRDLGVPVFVEYETDDGRIAAASVMLTEMLCMNESNWRTLLSAQLSIIRLVEED